MARLHLGQALTGKEGAGAITEQSFQLCRSRTKVTSAMGVQTLPDNVATVPIVITDSLRNAEA